VGRGRLLSVDLRIGLDPFAGLIVRNFIVIAVGEGRHDIHADDAVVRVVLGVDDDPEIYIDRSPLLAARFERPDKARTLGRPRMRENRSGGKV
jgi:hypothetical protein